MKCVNCNKSSEEPIVLCESCTRKRDFETAKQMRSVATTMLEMGINLKDKELTDRAKESLAYWSREVINGTL